MRYLLPTEDDALIDTASWATTLVFELTSFLTIDALDRHTGSITEGSQLITACDACSTLEVYHFIPKSIDSVKLRDK